MKGIKENIPYNKTVDELKEKEEYIALLEEDNASLLEQIENLNKAIATTVTSSSKADSNSFNLPCEESNYYEGEIDYIVYRALVATKNSLAGTDCIRQSDVLESLIESMEENSKALKGKEHVLKMKESSKNKNSSCEEIYSEMGFKKSRTSGHMTFVWNGDERYSETVSGTPSDARHMTNQMHDTCKKIYGIPDKQ